VGIRKVHDEHWPEKKMARKDFTNPLHGSSGKLPKADPISTGLTTLQVARQLICFVTSLALLGHLWCSGVGVTSCNEGDLNEATSQESCQGGIWSGLD
jgi:hypothetical protein